MKTTREERADLRARCKAGVIAITTDAGTVAALVDDVEEAETMYTAARTAESRLFAETNAEIERLAAELAEARAERDARPEITAADAAATVVLCALKNPAPSWLGTHEAAERIAGALRAHARKVAP